VAAVAHLDRGELRQVYVHKRGKPAQELGPLLRRHGTPGRKGRRGPLDGRVYLGLGGHLDARHNLLRGRVYYIVDGHSRSNPRNPIPLSSGESGLGPVGLVGLFIAKHGE
jgi:hypothetical protein